ncbi:GTP-binding protein [Boletus coccyginus]|nr:GTP-binding protein [Boletus coccyginus]
MSQERLRFRVPNVKFRVLIVGRANAGKTSILQRVCETTESPKIYRVRGHTREEIHLDPTTERGNHHIEDELVFTNHDGYVFHDSCGFEAGHEDELRIVQDFVREKATARRLRDRLHAIWYCIPMENDRPSLDMKFFGAICPDKNVPVIAVFTKYDQFKRDIRIKLEDNPGRNASVSQKEVADRAEKIFQDEYWNVIKGDSARHVRLQKTENALSNKVVTLMLLATQRGNLERSVKSSLRRIH